MTAATSCWRPGWSATRSPRPTTRSATSSRPAAGPRRRPNSCWPRRTARWPPRSRRPPWTAPQAAYRLFRSQQQRGLAAHAGWSSSGRSMRPSRCRPTAARARTRRLCGWRNSAPAMRPRRTCWPGGWRWTSAGAMPPTGISSRRPRSRRRGPAMSRATGWLGEALRAEAAGHPRRLLGRMPPGAGGAGRAPVHAGRRGTAGPGHRARRRAGRLAQRRAAQARPRHFLAWTERWRATALAVPRCGPRPTRNSMRAWPRCAG